MKKIIAILSAISLSTTVSITVIACGPNNKGQIIPEIPETTFGVDLSKIELFKTNQKLGAYKNEQEALEKVEYLINKWQNKSENIHYKIKMIDSVDITTDEQQNVKVESKKNQNQYINSFIFSYELIENRN